MLLKIAFSPSSLERIKTSNKRKEIRKEKERERKREK